jgi:hypothetical protein
MDGLIKPLDREHAEKLHRTGGLICCRLSDSKQIFGVALPEFAHTRDHTTARKWGCAPNTNANTPWSGVRVFARVGVLLKMYLSPSR